MNLPNKPEVGYIEVANENLDFFNPLTQTYPNAYDFQERRQILNYQEDFVSQTTTPDGIFDLIYDKDVVTTTTDVSFTERRTYTHRLKADEPIRIDFFGDGYRGDVTIDAAGRSCLPRMFAHPA